MAKTVRERTRLRARLAEDAERFEDMAKEMQQLVEMGDPLTQQDRKLLSVGFKNYVGERRAAWRSVHDALVKAEDADHQEEAEVIRKYMFVIAKEMKEICKELLEMLETELIPNCPADDVEARVQYFKMAADYQRYVAEVLEGKEKSEVVSKSAEAYQAAYDLSVDEMHPTHPIRLELALNFSVFLQAMMDDQERACQMAKQAKDDAAMQIDEMQDDHAEDSGSILETIKENLRDWAGADNS